MVAYLMMCEIYCSGHTTFWLIINGCNQQINQVLHKRATSEVPADPFHVWLQSKRLLFISPQICETYGGQEVFGGRDGRHRVHGVRKSEAQADVVSF